MNRRILALIAVVVAVPLFAAPLVSPIPNPEPHVRVSVGEPSPNPLPDEYGQVSETTYRYQNLSANAQHFFDAGVSADSPQAIALDEVPAPWVPPGNVTASAIAQNSGQILKDGRYYGMYLGAFTPQPPLVAAMLRFGALGGSIGLGTLAGYFVLTAED